MCRSPFVPLYECFETWYSGYVPYCAEFVLTCVRIYIFHSVQLFMLHVSKQPRVILYRLFCDTSINWHVSHDTKYVSHFETCQAENVCVYVADFDTMYSVTILPCTYSMHDDSCHTVLVLIIHVLRLTGVGPYKISLETSRLGKETSLLVQCFWQVSILIPGTKGESFLKPLYGFWHLFPGHDPIKG